MEKTLQDVWYLCNKVMSESSQNRCVSVEHPFVFFQIGTYGLGIAALELKKPVYVLTESFKFSRIYPLNQRDLPNEFKYLSSVLKSGKDLSKQHPLVDYTPPAYITLLFTDLGILTPSAVSDELIKLYL